MKKGGLENIENTANFKDGERMDHDGIWKALIKKFFPYLLKRAIPELYAEADTSAEPEFLDKEFTDILNTADPTVRKNPHYADFVKGFTRTLVLELKSFTSIIISCCRSLATTNSWKATTR